MWLIKRKTHRLEINRLRTGRSSFRVFAVGSLLLGLQIYVNNRKSMGTSTFIALSKLKVKKIIQLIECKEIIGYNNYELQDHCATPSPQMVTYACYRQSDWKTTTHVVVYCGSSMSNKSA
jgi:hypothetical protein